MKKIFIPIGVAVAMAMAMTSCNNPSTPQLENAQDTLSWAMGRSLAEGLLQNSGMAFNNEVVMAAIETTLTKGEQPLPDSVYNNAVQFLQMAMLMQEQKKAQQQTAEVQNNEASYFAQLEKENAQIKKTESGIRYEVLTQGKGKNAKYGEVVVFDYRGYNMLTGQMVDQTYGQRDPIQHVIGSPMFPGLVEGLQLMNAGSKVRFYFPNQLAFGANGTKNIPPHTPVIYEVELHKIVK